MKFEHHLDEQSKKFLIELVELLALRFQNILSRTIFWKG